MMTAHFLDGIWKGQSRTLSHTDIRIQYAVRKEFEFAPTYKFYYSLFLYELADGNSVDFFTEQASYEDRESFLATILHNWIKSQQNAEVESTIREIISSHIN